MPFVAAEPPPSWVAAEVAPPPIAEGTGARVVAWSAFRPPPSSSEARRPTFVRACIATAIPGWVEDMRPATEARLVGVVASTAERFANAPIEARNNDSGMLEIHAASAKGDDGRLGSARTFVGFDESSLYTCFALCAAEVPASTRLACDASAARATLEANREPPRPSLALAAVTWGIHHPREVGTSAAIFALVGGVLAIATRRRPLARAARSAGEKPAK